jgi:putative ABC transport system ATP-binding protein
MVVLVQRLHHQVLDHRSGFQATVIGHHALDHVVHDHHHGENGCSTGTPLFSARALEPIQSSRACWQQISFDLHKGDRLGLVAPSGAGKTLLLRALAQLDPLRSGELCCRGASPGKLCMTQWRAMVMLVAQRCAVTPGTVEDNLRLPLQWRQHRHHANWQRTTIVTWLETLGRSSDFLAWDAEQLSGGEQQVLNLLRALQLQPVLLLLDECTASLDPSTCRAMETLLQRWLSEAARACVFTSHDPDQIERFCNRVLALP